MQDFFFWLAPLGSLLLGSGAVWLLVTACRVSVQEALLFFTGVGALLQAWVLWRDGVHGPVILVTSGMLCLMGNVTYFAG